MTTRAHDSAFTVASVGSFALLVAVFLAVVVVLAITGAPGLPGLARDPDLPRTVYGTVLCTIVMTLVVVPLGVATAVHLSEYADPRSRVVAAVRRAVRTLASVPSIVLGLFGLGFFVLVVGRGLDAIAGESASALPFGRPGVLWASLTLAILTLPVVVVTSEEAIRAVPRELREASHALGASKLQTVVHVVLPMAWSGILTGVILAVARGAGEVAAILLTGVAAYVPSPPTDLRQGFQHLGFHVYVLATQAPAGAGADRTMFSFALVFVVAALALNAVAFALRDRARRTR